MQAYLIDNLTNKPVTINLDKFSIGRGLNCDYVLSSLQVSRVHCVIQKTLPGNNNWTIVDMSANGTLVNNVRVGKQTGVTSVITTRLNNGDTIQLADHTFTFNIATTIRNDIDSATTSNNIDSDLPASSSNSVISDSELVALMDAAEAAAALDRNYDDIDDKLPSKRMKTTDDNEDDENSIETKYKDLQCSVCSELFIKASTLNCAHSFCRYCINEWRRTKAICPICRAPITAINPTIVLDNLIETIFNRQSEKIKLTRRQVVETRLKVDEQAPAAKRQKKVTITATVVVSSDDDDDDDSSSSSSVFDYDLDYDSEFLSDDYDYDGSRYYGGYGSCFRCGGLGHWANTCRVRL